MNRDGAKTSIWQEEITGFQPQNQKEADKIYDVLVVGGGITGLTTALLLQEQGKKCILAEAYNIGFGTSGGTTAHLNTMLDTPYYQVENDFGHDGARLVQAAASKAIGLIHNLSSRYNFDCDFEYKQGFIFAQNEEQEEELQKIVGGAQRAGVDINIVDNIDIPIPYTLACVFEHQAQFNIGKYLVGLARAFEGAGGVILHNCMVSDIISDEYYTAETNAGLIKAEKVVYATHIPPGINLLHFRCAPYRSYACAFTLKDGRYPVDLLYDLEDPYHYIRSMKAGGEDYVIAGGYDHKTGHNDNTEQSFRELESYIRHHFSVEHIEYKWSSQYYSSADGLPYIGILPGHNNIYTATGFIGNGMVYGSISGKIISDLIVGVENPYADLFRPSRIKPIAGFTEFVKENADVISKFISMRFSYEQVNALVELAPGDAVLADWEGNKVALYKDEHGKVFAVDPVCPHAGCLVAWNNAEKTWDCPCHGGRYAPDGCWLTGPAKKGLQPLL